MILGAPRQRVCTVSLRADSGAPYYSHTTMATKVFEAVARAKEFFKLDFWKGPKPTPPSTGCTSWRTSACSWYRPWRWRDGNGPVEFEDSNNNGAATG